MYGDTKDITKFTIYGSCVGTTTVEFSYHAGTSQGWIYTYLNVEVFENKVSGITLDKSSVEVSVGHIINLTPTLSPNNATNKNVIWSSSDTSIVTVKDGVVRGIKEGQAIITATSEDGKYTAKCLVTVKFVHATGLEIRLEGYFSTYNVKIGETYKAIALVKPVNASNEDVVWESSDQSVATIDNDGNVKIVGKGIAHISATTVDGNISSNVIIFDSM